MNKQELIDLLEWQLESGVDCSFGDFSALKDLKKDKPSPAQSFATTMENHNNAPSSNAINQTENILEKSSFQNFMENTPPSYEKKPNEIKENKELIEEADKLATNSKNLSELKSAIEGFDGLSIKKLAKNCVFGEGNTESNLMLIGEAPGQNEDEEGRPFCGVSGRLLDKLFNFAGYHRTGKNKDDSFYITNTVFWRPPGNRKPLPEEIAICKPFVEKHIALINPKVIVLVGGTAVESILGIKDSVTKLRKAPKKCYNKFLDKEIECFTIYHPSFLLRQPRQKKNAWGDVLNIKKYIENL